MIKRGPTAASLAKPQYRQRAKPGAIKWRTFDNVEDLWQSFKDDGLVTGEWHDDPQIEGWQEPLRQMEG